MTFPSEQAPLTAQPGMNDTNKGSSLRWEPAGAGHPPQEAGHSCVPKCAKPCTLRNGNALTPKGNSSWGLASSLSGGSSPVTRVGMREAGG